MRASFALRVWPVGAADPMAMACETAGEKPAVALLRVSLGDGITIAPFLLRVRLPPLSAIRSLTLSRG